MTKYKCVKELTLDAYDDDGSVKENEFFEVRLGSVWELDEDSYRFATRQDSTRLLDSDSRWIEIHDDNLANHFIRI